MVERRKSFSSRVKMSQESADDKWRSLAEWFLTDWLGEGSLLPDYYFLFSSLSFFLGENRIIHSGKECLSRSFARWRNDLRRRPAKYHHDALSTAIQWNINQLRALRLEKVFFLLAKWDPAKTVKHFLQSRYIKSKLDKMNECFGVPTVLLAHFTCSFIFGWVGQFWALSIA